MKKSGWLLIIVGILVIFFYMIYIKTLEYNQKKYVDNYIYNTSDIEQEKEELSDINEEKTLKKNDFNYTAVLEIPVIGLKQGVIDSTEDSINFAISVDQTSNYPNEYGNFVLYAHSGNSSIAYFKHLIEVNIGDDIFIYFNGIKYHYITFEKYDIEKNGKAAIHKSLNDKYITLITCNQYREGFQLVLVGKIESMNKY